MNDTPSFALDIRGLRKSFDSHHAVAGLDLAVRRFNAFARLQAELATAQGKLADRDAVDRAKRFLMDSKGISEPEAYAELRRKAMSTNRRIAEIAEAVVTAHELLEGK